MSQQIITAYLFRRQQCQMRAIDAATETAEYFGVNIDKLAAYLISQGIDSKQLSLI